jgi:MFS family permease
MPIDPGRFRMAPSGHPPDVLTRSVGIATGICGIAAASLGLPSAPTTDAWGWIIWGRELAHGTLHTAVGGSPSWKPLPVLFTTLLSALGEHAPEGWLFLSRAFGLAGVVLAYLVATRLAGRAAGVVAALALALSGGWVRGLEHGYSEPVVIAALLGALLAHLEGRSRTALWLVAAATLARPELWPLLLVLALWLGRRDPLRRAEGLAMAAVVPVLWVGVDWLGSGRFMNGGKTAAQVAKHLSGWDMIDLALRMPALPVLVLAAAGATFAALRGDRLPATLAAATVGWAGVLAVAVSGGYPPTERLMSPLMAGVCVLAGLGAARAVALGGGSAGARAAVAVALVAVCLPFGVARVQGASRQVEAGEARARLQLDLRHAARMTRADAPGTKAVVLPAALIWSRGAVAWEWKLPLGDVGVIGRPWRDSRRFAFVPRSRHFRHAEWLFTTRDWRVLLDLRKSRADARRGPD